MGNGIDNWSFKKLKMYRQCPMQVRFQYIDRLPLPEKPAKFEEKRLRGVKAHDDLADCINVAAPVPQEFIDFEPIIEAYRALGAKAEDDEYFDASWKPMTPKFTSNGFPYGHWLVVKKDVRILTPTYSLTVDWKTGKKAGNEMDHFEQMKLYAVTEWLLHPGLPEYAVELQYLDQKDTWAHSFTPADLERHWAKFDQQVDIMMNDKVFRPKPSIPVCLYCPFNKKTGSGACPVAAL